MTKIKVRWNSVQDYLDCDNPRLTGRAVVGMSGIMKRRWSDPTYKKKMSEIMQGMEYKKKMSDAMQRLYQRRKETA